MTAIPCVASVPDTTCAAIKKTYTAIQSADKDGKTSMTLTISMPNVEDAKVKALMEDKANTAEGAAWAGLSVEGGKSGWASAWKKAAGAMTGPTSVKWECETDMTKIVDDKKDAASIKKACAKGACSSDASMAAWMKKNKCKIVAEPKPMWTGGAMTMDAKKGASMSMTAASSADGKVANTWNMAGKYQASMGMYGCNKGCKAVSVAAMTGWFPIVATTAGAAALAASATVATAALMF